MESALKLKRFRVLSYIFFTDLQFIDSDGEKNSSGISHTAGQIGTGRVEGFYSYL